MGDRFNIAVIGAGRVAGAHLAAIGDLSDSVRLVAVCDADGEKARAAAERHGAPRYHTDYRDLVQSNDVDGVVIALPNHLHCEVAIAASQAGMHVFVEKPMAMTVVEADAMIEAARASGVTLMVGQSRRFSRGIAVVREHMDRIGTPFRIDISFLVDFPKPMTNWWTTPDQSGPLVIPLQGSHSLDTIVWLKGGLPETVYAVSSLHNEAFRTVDESTVALKFPDGGLATVHLSLNTSPYSHELTIVGDGGTIRKYEHPTDTLYGFRNRVTVNDTAVFDEEELPSLYTNELSEFVQAIREAREPASSGAENRNTMLVLDAAVRSSVTGKVVALES